MADFLEEAKSLVRTITDKFRAKHPEVPRAETSEVRPKIEDDGKLPIHGGGGETYRYYQDRTRLMRSRKGLYDHYDEMDEECPEFHSALDIYAENATQGADDREPSITIVSEDAKIVTLLEQVKKDLCLEDGLWELARDVAKYGERAEELIVQAQPLKLIRLKSLPTHSIIPKRDKYGRVMDPAYVQLNDNGEVIAQFRDWQVVHFANKKSRSDLTGTGLGFAARKGFEHLRMMKEAIVIGRLTRAHNRLAYLVDTGGLPPEEAQAHLEKVKNRLRKRRLINPVTGRLEKSTNPLATVDEDVFVATNAESKADVKVLMGDLTVGNIDDILLFQQEIYTSMKVPKSYLANEKDSKTKTIVSEQDIQFARSVRRIQRVIEAGLTQIFDFALLLHGLDPKRVKYEVHLPTITVSDELRKSQTEQLRMITAELFKKTFWADDEFIFTKILGFDSEDAKAIIAKQVKPDKFSGLYEPPPPPPIAAPKKKKESEDRAEQLKNLLAEVSEEDLEEFTEHVDSLRALCELSLSELKTKGN